MTCFYCGGADKEEQSVYGKYVEYDCACGEEMECPMCGDIEVLGDTGVCDRCDSSWYNQETGDE